MEYSRDQGKVGISRAAPAADKNNTDQSMALRAGVNVCTDMQEQTWQSNKKFLLRLLLTLHACPLSGCQPTVGS